MNTKEWIIKFDFRGEKGQGTSQATTVFEGNTKRTAGVYYRRGLGECWRRAGAHEQKVEWCEKFRRLLEENQTLRTLAH